MDEKSAAIELARNVCERLKQLLGENLASCVLYGSVVREDLVPRRSDVNLLIVLNQSTPESHRAIGELLSKFPSIAPFVLSKWELPRSRQVFALKFRSIGRFYRVLHGEDSLANFVPSPTLLRFLCEQSLRNLRLRLKHAYIRGAVDPACYQAALLNQVSSLFATLSEILRCSSVEVPADRDRQPDIIGRELRADASVLTDLRALRKRPHALSSKEAFDIHERLHALLSAALDRVREQWPQATEIA